MHHQPPIRAVPLTMAVFVLQPLAMGGWFALIPFVQRELDLSKSELALALLGSPAALIIALQFAGRLVARFGARRVFMILFPVQAFSVMLPLLATNAVTLFIMLMALGGAIGFLEVCLNTYAGRLEILVGRKIMNRCHGFWSLGIMLGSLWVVLVVQQIGPALALGSIAILSAVAGFGAAYALPSIGSASSGGAAPLRRSLKQLPLAVILISILLLPVTMTEGAMADWAAIYLAERLPDGAGRAGIAVTIYAGALTLGRFLGDWLNRHFGPVRLARATIVVAIIGIGLLVLPLPLAFAYVGFVMIGLGISVSFPLGVSATASLGSTHQAGNIAIMSTFAISGFLVGPPIIGFLAEWASLGVGLAMLIPALCVSLWLSGNLAGTEPDNSDAPSPARNPPTNST